MNAQEQMETLLKELYSCLAEGEQIPGRPGKVIADRSRLLQLTDEIQDTFYSVLRAQSAAGSAALPGAAGRKEQQLISRAQEHAEDVYAASLMYSDGMIGELKTLMDKTNESLEEVMQGFRTELRRQQDMLVQQESELHAQLQDLADTGKYLQLIEEENLRRAGQTGFDGSGQELKRDAADEIRNAEYYKRKEAQALEEEQAYRIEEQRRAQEKARRMAEQREAEEQALRKEQLRAEEEARRSEELRRAAEQKKRQDTKQMKAAETKAAAAKTADLSDPAAAAAAFRKGQDKPGGPVNNSGNGSIMEELDDDWGEAADTLPDEDVLMKAMLAGEMEGVQTDDAVFGVQSRNAEPEIMDLDFMDFDEPSDLSGLDELEPIDKDDDDFEDGGRRGSGKKGGKLKGFLLGN